MIRALLLIAALAGAASAQTTSATEEKPVSHGGMTGTETTRETTRSSQSNATQSDSSVRYTPPPLQSGQTNRSSPEEEAIGAIFGAIFGQPQQAESSDQPRQESHARWTYLVEESNGQFVCQLYLHSYMTDDGDARLITPSPRCPRAWLGVRAYRLIWNAGTLDIYDGGSEPFWSGRRESDDRFDGRSREGFAYRIRPETEADTPGGSPLIPDTPGGDTNADSIAESLYGQWRMAETNSFGGCTVEFLRPDPDSAFSQPNEIRTPAGCPGQVMFADEWTYDGRNLRLVDNFNRVQATLTRRNADWWDGQTKDGDAIEMSRR